MIAVSPSFSHSIGISMALQIHFRWMKAKAKTKFSMMICTVGIAPEKSIPCTSLFSVILLLNCLQGYFGRILYTGDFRFREEMFIETALSDVGTIDVLYLDNTYCQPHCSFPTRSEALEQIIRIIERHPGNYLLIKYSKIPLEWPSSGATTTFNSQIVDRFLH